MTAGMWTTSSPPKSTGEAALDWAAKTWLFVAVVGQWAFFAYIAGFYGPPTLTGNFEAWRRNKDLIVGYVKGDSAGNLAFAVHVLLAAVIALGGALQLLPQIRTRVPTLHRWNGRLFLVIALAASVTGLYMVWVRGVARNPSAEALLGASGISLDAILIIVFGVLAWRSALRRNMAAHRRWALRTYMVANGQWFFRVGVFGVMMLNHGHVGIFYLIWGYGCYLVPLAVLEIYLRAKAGGSPAQRWAVAGGVAALTVLMGVGVAGVYTLAWRPLL